MPKLTPKHIQGSLPVIVGCLLTLLAAGCETGGQTGALAGAGIGALAGQAIGGNTTATLIGAGVGTGIGYIIGNEDDKKKSRRYSAETRSRDYDHDEEGPFPGTKWSLVSVNPKNRVPEGSTVTVEFGSNSHVLTTYTYPDGTVNSENERYRVVGEYLIVNSPNYLVNYNYKLTGDQLILKCDEFTATLRKM